MVDLAIHLPVERSANGNAPVWSSRFRISDNAKQSDKSSSVKSSMTNLRREKTVLAGTEIGLAVAGKPNAYKIIAGEKDDHENLLHDKPVPLSNMRSHGRNRVFVCCSNPGCHLEPVFEADFQPGSFGYRPKRTAHDAIKRVAEAIVRRKTRVLDFDLRQRSNRSFRQLELARR